MILGLGTDLCAQHRVESLLKRFGDRFLARVFSKKEIMDALGAHNHRRKITMLTSAFAAKEATSKALGTGIRRLGTGEGFSLPVFWTDIESGRLASGKPFLRLFGNARKIARARAEKADKAIACVEISLSDEGGMTHALVALYACARSSLHEDSIYI